MATIVLTPQTLPERDKPLPPGARPPITFIPVLDEPGHADEVDLFRKQIRKIRNQVSTRSQ